MVRALTFAVAVAIGSAVPAAAQTLTIDPGSSTATIEVGKAGMFSFAAGHTHEVRGPIESGTIAFDAHDAARNRVNLVIGSSALQVSPKGEPPDDVPKVQAAMQGEKVLDSARFPKITFASTAVSGVREAPSFDATVSGTLTIRGKSQPVTTTVHVQRTADALTATGRFTIRQTAFGIQPISVAGVVKVEDELKIAFAITAKP